MDIIAAWKNKGNGLKGVWFTKQTLPRNTGDVSRKEQLCLGISLQKPKELERLSEAEVCQIRKKKGLYTQLLFVHLDALLFSITNLTNNLVPSVLGGPQTPLQEAAAAAGMPQVSRKDEQVAEVQIFEFIQRA